MTNLVRRFIDDETGATAIEYGLIAAGIAVAIIVAVMRSARISRAFLAGSLPSSTRAAPTSGKNSQGK